MSGYDYEPGGAATPAPEPGAPAPEPVDPLALSPAVQRFQSCRWRKIAEDGVPDHCTHRDVQPMAGTAGFDAGAWCLDCGFYKIRRNPRKRPAAPPFGNDRSYY
jgi:hypothetical protein